MSFGTVLSSIFAVLLSLGLVIALAWGALWLLRRFQDRALGANRAASSGRVMRFVRALPLGPRERLVLVEVDGEEMLLGITANGITELRRWSHSGHGGPTVAEGSGPDPAAKPRFRLPVAGVDRPRG